MVQTFTTSINSYDSGCEDTLSVLNLSDTVSAIGYGCSPIFQWTGYDLIENSNASLNFNQFSIVMGV